MAETAQVCFEYVGIVKFSGSIGSGEVAVPYRVYGLTIIPDELLGLGRRYKAVPVEVTLYFTGTWILTRVVGCGMHV
jgi:uncharacterized membrane protein